MSEGGRLVGLSSSTPRPWQLGVQVDGGNRLVTVEPVDRSVRAYVCQLGGVERADSRDDAELIVRAVNEYEALLEAARLVSAYYAYHSEDGSEVCPCEVCEKARPYFAALLKARPTA